MIKTFLYIFVLIAFMVLPKAFAQTTSNSDFNPFPQMEQDVNNNSDQATVTSDQQNDEETMSNTDAPSNNEGAS